MSRSLREWTGGAEADKSTSRRLCGIIEKPRQLRAAAGAGNAPGCAGLQTKNEETDLQKEKAVESIPR